MHNNKKKPRAAHGGARTHAGRPKKQDAHLYTTISCVLRTETVEKLRAGADSRLFGPYLQWILDRTYLPSHEEYMAAMERKPLPIILRKRRVPAIVSVGSRQPKPRPIPEEMADFAKDYVAEMSRS
jgi:hypothetical protein